MTSTQVLIALAVGSKVPADLRLVELLSNVFRTDQVCPLQLTRTAAAHTPMQQPSDCQAAKARKEQRG